MSQRVVISRDTKRNGWRVRVYTERHVGRFRNREEAEQCANRIKMGAEEGDLRALSSKSLEEEANLLLYGTRHQPRHLAEDGEVDINGYAYATDSFERSM